VPTASVGAALLKHMSYDFTVDEKNALLLVTLITLAVLKP
jgi:hypothetical protein